MGQDYTAMTALQQGQLGAQITGASAYVIQYCSAVFVSTTDTLRLTADGYSEIDLAQHPVTTVNTVTDVYTGLAMTLNLPGTAGYYQVYWDGLQKLVCLYPWQTVDVNLTYGFSSVPDDIASVVTQMTIRTFLNPTNLSDRRVGDVEYRWTQPSSVFTPNAFEVTIMDVYRETEFSWRLAVRPDYIDPHDFSRNRWGWY